MRKGFAFPSILVLTAMLAACSQDPVPTVVTGNPRIDLVRDSVAMLGQAGERPLIFEMAVTAEGDFYAAGAELRTDNSFTQGNLWKLSAGGTWESALDPASQALLQSVRGLAVSPSGALWITGHRRQQGPLGYSIILRGFDDNWMEVSPESTFEATRVSLAGEEDAWFYGQSDVVLHYENGSWEYTMLPEKLVSAYGDTLWVEAVAADAVNTYALVKVGLFPEEGRVVMQYHNGVWQPFYAEGSVDTTALPNGAMLSAVNRELRTLLLHRDGSLRGIGAAVYRWNGERFEQEFRPRNGASLLTASRAPDGQMMAGGVAMASAWSDGLSWFHVHMAYDATPSIEALAFNDSVGVLAVSDTMDASSSILRGPISRVTPP
ncbi:MAG: hypothetical protein RRA94_08870 [Bacteroidota bacterium]|nr:hypothetical protein [Bacteroidota bacterium]